MLKITISITRTLIASYTPKHNKNTLEHTPKPHIFTCSCILISWNLVNLEPLVCKNNLPPDLFVTHSLLGHALKGMKDVEFTCK